MSYTVNQLAKMAGISIRTLHHYDEIGLLKPAFYGENRYRYYQEEELLILQQILFYRDLGISLHEIKEIIYAKNFDKIASLKSHRKKLKTQRESIENLISTINKTILHLRGKEKMKVEQFYYGFDTEKQKDMENYLVSNIGSHFSQTIEHAKQKLALLTDDEKHQMYKQTEKLCAEFKRLIIKDYSPGSFEAQKLIKTHYNKVKKFCSLTRDEFVTINKLDITHPHSKALFDAVHQKFADFFLQAIIIFSEKI